MIKIDHDEHTLTSLLPHPVGAKLVAKRRYFWILCLYLRVRRISRSVSDKMKKKTKILIAISILILIGFYLFNFKSNIHFLIENSGVIKNYEINNQLVLHDNSEVTIRKIYIRRKEETLINRLINKISRPTAYYIEFKNNSNNFKVGYYEKGSTAPNNITDKTKFSINSAFYNSNFEPNGLIVSNGEEYGIKSNSSGHFKVINGKAIAGPTSIFSRSKKVEYSCQSHPSVMKNGVIWDYITNETKNKSYWKSKTYRSLVGQNNIGNICFIVSGNGGLLSIKEITQMAKKNEIETATCLDAGAALQYSYKDEEYKLSFSSMNNKLSLGKTIDQICTRMIGKRFYNESPAYINYE